MVGDSAPRSTRSSSLRWFATATMIDGRRHLQVDHAADVQIGQLSGRGRSVGREHGQHFALGVTVRGGRDQPFVVVQPGQQPVAHAVRLAVLRDGAVPVVERERLAARADRQPGAVRAERRTVQETLRGHEAAVALGARAAQANVDPGGRVLVRVEQVQVGARVVDEPLAVAGQVARVVVLVVGVAPQVLARGRARVDVAEAFVVGQEVDPLADPARSRQIAVQTQQRPERAAAVGVDPERAGRAAAIALPVRGVAERVARQDDCAPRSVDDCARPGPTEAGVAVRRRCRPSHRRRLRGASTRARTGVPPRWHRRRVCRLATSRRRCNSGCHRRSAAVMAHHRRASRTPRAVPPHGRRKRSATHRAKNAADWLRRRQRSVCRQARHPPRRATDHLHRQKPAHPRGSTESGNTQGQDHHAWVEY